MTLPNF